MKKVVFRGDGTEHGHVILHGDDDQMTLVRFVRQLDVRGALPFRVFLLMWRIWALVHRRELWRGLGYPQ